MQPEPASPREIDVSVAEATAAGASNRISIENSRTGDPGWHLQNAEVSTDVLAYASPQSINARERVAIRTSARHGPVKLDVYRVGWYGGAGGRKYYSAGYAASTWQTCATDLPTGLVECAWPDTFTIPTTHNWVSGVYLAKVTDSSTPPKASYAFFVVREDSRQSPILAQLPTNTYQAYNAFGGASLYGKTTPTYVPGGSFPYSRAVKVSFNRPYVGGAGSGYFFMWDAMMIRFLERNGYDVSYVTNADVDRVPGLLAGYRMFVSMGHDEYWSKAQRDRVESAVTAGMHYGVFSGNVAYWHVRLEPSTIDGAPARTLVCYRSTSGSSVAPGDPTYVPGGDNSDVTVKWRDPANNRPENQLLGGMYVGVNPILQAHHVSKPTSWVFAGTGLQAGDPIPSLLGWEVDVRTPTQSPACSTCAPSPSPSTISAIASTDIVLAGYNDLARAEMMVYRRSPTSGQVFHGESYGWNWGLGDTPIANAATQRITANVLNHLGSLPATPAPPAPAISPGFTLGACPSEPKWSSRVVLTVDPSQGRYPMSLDYVPGIGLFAADPDGRKVWKTSGAPGGVPVAYATSFPVYGLAHAGNTLYLLGTSTVGTLDVTTGAQGKLSYAGPALSGMSAHHLAYNEENGRRRLYVSGLKAALGVIDLDARTAAQLIFPSLGRTAALAPQGDGTMLALVNYTTPTRIYRIDPRTITNVLAPPTPLPAARAVFDSAQRGGTALKFGPRESGLLLSLSITTQGGQIFVSRTGRGDVARLTVPSSGLPTVCSIAGTGRRGTSAGTTTDMPSPYSIIAGPNGTLYVSDPSNARVLQLFK